MTTVDDPPNKGGRPSMPADERLSFSFKQSLKGRVGSAITVLAEAAGVGVPEYCRDIIDAHLTTVGSQHLGARVPERLH